MHINTRTEPLRARIREALVIGRLPGSTEVRVSGGCGDATHCACCEAAIHADQVRLIIASTRGADGRGAPIAMHPPCAQIWFDEAEKSQFDLIGPDLTRGSTWAPSTAEELHG